MCYCFTTVPWTDLQWIEDKFKAKPLLVEANKMAMRAGYNYCEATEAFQVSYESAREAHAARIATSVESGPGHGFRGPRRKRPAFLIPRVLSDHARFRHPP